MHSNEFDTVTVNDFKEYREQCALTCRASPSDRWVYRGQSNADWPLRTKLERAMSNKAPLWNTTRRRAENLMLREFKRHLHRHLTMRPADVDRLEWLALMQHHGAPTRLLDFTFSQYVALFFAVRDAVPGQFAAVYAINQTACWEHFKEMLPEEKRVRLKRERHGESNDKDPRIIRWVLTEMDRPAVCPLNPFRVSERSAIQQGTFMVPLQTEETFEANLAASIKPSCVRKIVFSCTPEFLRDVWLELQRVNLTDHTLFPGLDGFARSLELSVVLHALHPAV